VNKTIRYNTVGADLVSAHNAHNEQYVIENTFLALRGVKRGSNLINHGIATLR